MRDRAGQCAPCPWARRHGIGLPVRAGGDETYPVKLWREKNGCPDEPDRIEDWAVPGKYDFKRYVWESCASQKSVMLDIHKRGHFIPIGWIRKQLNELL